jgi:hypothetical protein
MISIIKVRKVKVRVRVRIKVRIKIRVSEGSSSPTTILIKAFFKFISHKSFIKHKTI